MERSSRSCSHSGSRWTAPPIALDVYRVLRASNPSPYMYLLRLPAPDGTVYDVVGSSPEALVKVTGRRAITHPMRARGREVTPPKRTSPTVRTYWLDAKERSEHVMLVDLSRNDLQRVCPCRHRRRGGVHDDPRYSHIMHWRSHGCR